MVNKEIIEFLHEGTKRGFSIQILKQKLLEAGFIEKDVNKAIDALSKGKALPRTPNQPGTHYENKKSRKLMKIAGWFGIIMLVIFILLVILIIIPQTADFLNSIFEIMMFSIIFFIFLITFLVFYYLGLAKLGKCSESKILHKSSWTMLVYSVIIPITFVLMIIFSWKSLVGAFAALAFISLFGGSKLILYSIFALVLTYFTIYIFLSIGLIKIGSKVKFAKLAGIITLSYIMLSLLTGVISMIIPLQNLQAIVNIVSILILLLGITSLLFISLTLLNGSKQFER